MKFEKFIPKSPAKMVAIASVLLSGCAETKQSLQLNMPQAFTNAPTKCMAYTGGIPETPSGMRLQALLQAQLGINTQDCLFDSLAIIPDAARKIGVLYKNNPSGLSYDLEHNFIQLFEILENDELFQAAQTVHSTLAKLPFQADENVLLERIANTNPQEIAIKVLSHFQKNPNVVITKSNRKFYIEAIVNGVAPFSPWKFAHAEHLQKAENEEEKRKPITVTEIQAYTYFLDESLSFPIHFFAAPETVKDLENLPNYWSGAQGTFEYLANPSIYPKIKALQAAGENIHSLFGDSTNSLWKYLAEALDPHTLEDILFFTKLLRAIDPEKRVSLLDALKFTTPEQLQAEIKWGNTLLADIRIQEALENNKKASQAVILHYVINLKIFGSQPTTEEIVQELSQKHSELPPLTEERIGRKAQNFQRLLQDPNEAPFYKIIEKIVLHPTQSDEWGIENPIPYHKNPGLAEAVSTVLDAGYQRDPSVKYRNPIHSFDGTFSPKFGEVFFSYYKDLAFLLRKQDIPQRLWPAFLQGAHYGITIPETAKDEESIKKLDVFNNSHSLSHKEKKNFLRLLSLFDISQWTTVVPATRIIASPERTRLLSDEFIQFAEQFHSLDFSDLSQLLQMYQKGETQVQKNNFPAIFQNIAGVRRSIFRSDSNAMYFEGESSIATLSDMEQIKLGKFLEIFTQDLLLQQAIKDAMQKDFYDHSTEYGGIIQMDNNGLHMHVDDPTKKTGDGSYFANEETINAFASSDFFYHFHAVDSGRSTATFSS